MPKKMTPKPGTWWFEKCPGFHSLVNEVNSNPDGDVWRLIIGTGAHAMKERLARGITGVMPVRVNGVLCWRGIEVDGIIIVSCFAEHEVPLIKQEILAAEYKKKRRRKK